ncbi:class I SAM-dependent methyltransferase [Aliagarivorans marinus]|uniref:class I SAM-dependent methyltransferase n=1 Tax=Aliagarivorans marinus TaxID=561965 RepID=UPI00040761BE|nr:class I SAM-dependent methyltransferase [Aliagarivorans marinus]
MGKPEQFWDKVAEKYSRSPVSDEAAYQKKLKQTQQYMSSHMRVLEFGCGTGTTAIHHAPHVAHIDAIDLSNNMLDIARDKAQQAGVSNITFHQGTLEQFNVESESMGMVLGLSILHLLPNRDATLSEVARILKPGGVFVSSTACLGSSMLRYITWLAPLGKLLNLMPDVYVMTERQLAGELINHGFAIETQWHHGTKNSSVFIIARKDK